MELERAERNLRANGRGKKEHAVLGSDELPYHDLGTLAGDKKAAIEPLEAG